jgi:hypothetical protein
MNLTEYIVDYGKKHDYINDNPIDILIEQQSTDVFDALFLGGFKLGSFLAKLAKEHWKKNFTKEGRRAAEKADIAHRLEMVKSRKELKNIMGDLDSVLGEEDKKTQAELVSNIEKNEKQIAKNVKKQDKADKKVKELTDKLKKNKGDESLKAELKKAKANQTKVSKEVKEFSSSIVKPKEKPVDEPEEDEVKEPDEADKKIDTAKIDDDKKEETKAIKSEIDAIKKEKDPEKRATLIAKAKEHIDKAKKKFGVKTTDVPVEDEDTDEDEPTTKKEIQKAIERNKANTTKWTAELKTTNPKSTRGKQLRSQISRASSRIKKWSKKAKKLGEANKSFDDFYNKIQLNEDELADLEKSLKDLEAGGQPNDKATDVPDVDTKDTEVQPEGDIKPVDEIDPNAEPEDNVTTEIEDETTGEIKEEDPEELDISLKPFQQKQNMIITMLKEFGYSNFDIKIQDGENTLILKGKIDKGLKKSIMDLSKDLNITTNIEIDQVEDDKFLSKVKFKNNIDLKKFKDVYKVLKRQDKEKQAAELETTV